MIADNIDPSSNDQTSLWINNCLPPEILFLQSMEYLFHAAGGKRSVNQEYKTNQQNVQEAFLISAEDPSHRAIDGKGQSI